MEDVEPQVDTQPEPLIAEIPTDQGIVYAEIYTDAEPL